MIADLFATLIALVVTLPLVLLMPSSARCPVGWSLHEGVRRSGEFACYGPLSPAGCGEPVGPEVPCRKPEITRSRVHCTGGSIPVVRDHRTVACQMPH